MWIKKINEFFENLSEYDNNSLVLHVAVDLIDMLKERVTFDLDDDCNVCIKVLEPTEEGELAEVSVKKQKENLVEKYKKFKKSNGG